MRIRLLPAHYVTVLVLATAVVVFAVYLLLSRPPSSPLAMISSNAGVGGISAKCTFGTNHIYHYGDSVDRTVDLFVGRLSKRYASRLEAFTTDPSTVFWVRLQDPAFATATPAFLIPMRARSAFHQFRARLMDQDGSETVLELKASLQDGLGGYFVGGWSLPGPLAAHRGSVLHVELTNGTDLVTFRVP